MEFRVYWEGSNERIHRLYVHEIDQVRRQIPFSYLVVNNPSKGILQLMYKESASPEPSIDESTMVIAISGMRLENIDHTENAAYGVYFGHNSRYNTSGVLPPTFRQTSYRAEIEAVTKALEKAQRICLGDHALTKIKIMLSSERMVHSMVRGIYVWKENNGVDVHGYDLGGNGRGNEVESYEELEKLHELLDDMYYGDAGGIDVQFWFVDAHLHRGALGLAAAALRALPWPRR